MRLETARDVKNDLVRFARGLIGKQAVPDEVEPAAVAVGLTVGGPTYGVAVRLSGSTAFTKAVAQHGHDLAGEAYDVRDVGRIRPLRWLPAELQQRHRPLRPGLSIAHTDVSAGTLGTFVVPTRDGGSGTGGVHVLSNNHVIADSDRGTTGDVIVQPGPADGGAPPADRIGVLDRVISLDATTPAVVDAATARLDDGVNVEPDHPAGPITGIVVEPHTDLAVEKVGRTTGLTTGRVSAIELDGLAVEYPTGIIEFDGQIEITGSAQTPRFSSGGDSGSLVYSPQRRAAVGLLFAGSEFGGENGAGLTYCNPIGVVLDELGIRLMTS